jgi:Zn-dependent protease with chaperone function
MMTNAEFEALVHELEGDARRNPAAYQLKVLAIAWLGNAYLGAMLLLIVALLGGTIVGMVMSKSAVAVKLVFVVGIFLWVVLKALWVRLPPPEGLELDARSAPELFAMIEALRRQLGAPRFHHVLLTDDFNAAVVQSPRLGIFGWPRNYLLIGLPLMKGLTVEQFKAVLAHEFGHLAKGHGQAANWIYRQRLRWSRLMETLETTESGGRFLFKPFLNWFAPYFNAYSFPLARANEYEADATSARLTSASAAAAALTNVNVVGAYLAERYWPQIHKQVEDQPQPRFAPFSSMSHHVATEVEPALAQRWLDRAMEAETTLADTHPALADRLKAIGEAPRLAPPAAGEAADRLLGASLAGITERFDQRWQQLILASWQQRHLEVAASRRRLAELNERHASGAELTLQETYDRAILTESPGNDAENALGQLRALHERAPDDPVVCFALGSRLLERDEESGAALLERAAQLDETSIAVVCERMRDYHWRIGRKDEAKAWHQRLLERAELQRAAEEERKNVTTRDTFEPHGLPPDVVAALIEQLRAVPGLRKAYLARKRVAHLTHRPFFVLGFTCTAPFRFYRIKRANEVLRKIKDTVPFPGETWIMNVEGENSRFKRKFKRIDGARIV